MGAPNFYQSYWDERRDRMTRLTARGKVIVQQFKGSGQRHYFYVACPKDEEFRQQALQLGTWKPKMRMWSFTQDHAPTVGKLLRDIYLVTELPEWFVKWEKGETE